LIRRRGRSESPTDPLRVAHRFDPQESPLSQIAIECSPVDGGWLACVTVTDHGTSRDFEVAISDEELRHLEPDSDDPAAVVRRSFEFLLAREPKESILSSFGLSVIGRYYPEYEREIRRR
jgi:hypothetical protein